MMVLVDCQKQFRGSFSDDFCRHILQAVHSLKKGNPQVDFGFLADKNPRPGFGFPATLGTTHIRKTLPGIRNWERVIGTTARKKKTDMLICTDGIAHPKLKIPQVVWLPKPNDFAVGRKKSLAQFQKLIKQTVANAALLLASSPTHGSKLEEEYPGISAKLMNIPPFKEDDINALTWAEKEKARKELSQGKEFLCMDITDCRKPVFINMLMAFGAFKKRLRTNLQLAIVGEGIKALKKTEEISTFRYRQDIIFPSEEEQDKWLAIAYGLMIPARNFQLMLRAFALEIPVIANSRFYTDPLYVDNLLTADFDVHEDLTRAIINLYKDEQLRNKTIEKAKASLSGFSDQTTAEIFWKRVSAIIPS